MGTMRDIQVCWCLVGQQVAGADSICAKNQEGYGRQSSREYRNFLSNARGSVQARRVRYERMTAWVPLETIRQCVHLCDEIIAIPTATIRRRSEKEGE